jgi:hypothetical protein
MIEETRSMTSCAETGLAMYSSAPACCARMMSSGADEDELRIELPGQPYSGFAIGCTLDREVSVPESDGQQPREVVVIFNYQYPDRHFYLAFPKKRYGVRAPIPL